MQTQLFSYHFNITDPAQAAQYKALCEKLTAEGLKCFESHGGHSHWIQGAENGLNIELKTEQLFDNQWITPTINKRVFDWAQDYPSNLSGCSSNIKRGHYLVQTAEMKAARKNRLHCNYCGKQYNRKGAPTFCNACLDSEYLKSGDLHLLRLTPVTKDKIGAELSEAEKATLLPLYKHAQLHGNTERGKKRIADKRESIEKNYKHAIHKAETEYKGFTWLLDKGINLNNVIYYSHSNTFCFGWRDKGVDKELESDLLDIISEFPFAYEIKCADGRTLQGS